MKLHPIFSKKYQIWWLAMSIICFIKFYVFGFPTMYENKNYGFLFWIIGTLFTALVFGSILYLIYRLIARKWNNNAFIILISIMCFLTLFAYN
jgi:hypothetical protein